MKLRLAAIVLTDVASLALVANIAHCDWTHERIESILAPPTQAEIDAVALTWDRPDDEPTSVEIVEEGVMRLENVTYDVRVIQHEIEARRHYTAVLVPTGATPNSLPVLVECRGVRWDYPQRDIRNGPFAVRVLGNAAGSFILVEPCLRGHELRVLEQVFRAEGDHRDSYDGATDDVVAAVSATLAAIPEADEDRVFTIGLSRGGSLALLHGMRDRRVDGVVAMSAPVDWLELMKRPGEDWGGRIKEAANGFDGPQPDRATQFYEWFLQDRDALGLSEIRRRIIASSPRYFVDRLPPTHVHQGTADSSIPIVNATALAARFKELHFVEPAYKVYIHENAGHVLRESNAYELASQFLVERAKSLLHSSDGN